MILNVVEDGWDMFTRRFSIGLLLSFLLILSLPLPIFALGTPAHDADINVNVFDLDGHAVPDMQIFVDYQTNGNKSTLNGHVDGFTNVRGSWHATIHFAANITPAQYVQIVAYAPYWTSQRVQARISTVADEQTVVNFTVPSSFDTYRVHISSSSGSPLPGVLVRLTSPMFLAHKTDSGGLVQLRFPHNLPVAGWVEYAGTQSNFSFPTRIDSDTPISQVDFPIPLSNASASKAWPFYNWSAQVFDPAGRVIASRPILITAPGVLLNYTTDSEGELHMRDIPFETLNLTWIYQNITYNSSISVPDAPAKITTPVLLTILPPQVLSLGESCYRVLVNITDPRPDAIQQVSAVPEKEGDLLPFTLDQHVSVNKSLNKSQVQFYRIVCVVSDTGFDILASNQYESTRLRIQLRRSSTITAMPATNAAVIDKFPVASHDKQDDAKRIELVVILFELLIFLITVYLLIRFRELALYYVQTIVRYLHIALLGIRQTGRGKGANAPVQPPSEKPPASPPKI